MKFLIFGTDVLPLAGRPTSGTALRTFGLGQGLRAHGHEVEVSVPRDALANMLRESDLEALTPAARAEVEGLRETAFDYRNQTDVVHSVRPDVVLCGHWPAATFQTRIRPVLVIDLAGPHLLERHYQGMGDHAGAVLGKLRAVSNADHFIVSGPKQRLYFLSFLLRAGVERPQDRIVTIPMPLSPALPERKPCPRGDAFPRVVFAGVFLPWQDPTFGLERIAAALAERRRGTLTLIGGPHPHYDDLNSAVYTRLFEKLARYPFVRRLPMLPLDRFADELASADVAIDLMRWNLERELAMTIRSTTYLWSGLPVIYNDFADLGDLIREYDAGWTIPPEDEGALGAVIDELFGDPAAVDRKGASAQRLAREVFSWDRAVRPLLDALGTPRSVPRNETDFSMDIAQNAEMDVLAEAAVEQQFVSRIDGLFRVECRLATHQRLHIRPVTISLFRLADDDGGPARRRELIARRSVGADAIPADGWVAMEVDPIPDSAGRVFALTLESAARDKDETVSPWAFEPRVFPMLGLSRGGRAFRGRSLCFRTTSTRVAS